MSDSTKTRIVLVKNQSKMQDVAVAKSRRTRNRKEEFGVGAQTQEFSEEEERDKQHSLSLVLLPLLLAPPRQLLTLTLVFQLLSPCPRSHNMIAPTPPPPSQTHRPANHPSQQLCRASWNAPTRLNHDTRYPRFWTLHVTRVTRHRHHVSHRAGDEDGEEVHPCGSDQDAVVFAAASPGVYSAACAHTLQQL